jgi:hypothetical protein
VNIAMINGSPKTVGSASARVLDYLQEALGDAHDFTRVHALRDIPASVAAGMGADALVVAFPLYVDGMPSHLAGFLEGLLAEPARPRAGTPVYCVAQSGFIEPEQNRLAIAMIRSFCKQAELTFAQAVAIGGGPMTETAPLGKGPFARVGRALDELAVAIATGAAGDDRFVSPAFPRFLYIRAAHIGWRLRARKAHARLRSRPL